MSVNKAIDLSLTTDFGSVSYLSLRDTGRRFITGYRAAGYSRSYIKRLEETIGYLAGYYGDQGWPPVSHITPQHLEEYLAYSRTRRKGYGKRKITGDAPLQQLPGKTVSTVTPVLGVAEGARLHS